ncbi:MAG TPA: FAD:protein FMN transferase [Firmicutes bacterium]|nr:FAD:protein FMN transferase [Candidatus Fermentithermobacillaceae bacterium]
MGKTVAGSRSKSRVLWSVGAMLLALLLAAGVPGCGLLASRGKPVEKEAYGIMDTDVTVKAYGRNAGSAIDKAIHEMKRLDALLSAYNPESEVAAINREAGIKPVKVSPDTLFVIQRAVYFAEISDGAFDPTVLPLMKLWGFGSGSYRVPRDDEIKEALKLVDYRKIRINAEESTVYLEEKGMGIDLGAIAKGYAVDKMAEILRKEGITSFLINAGGNVYAGGLKPDQTMWRVGVTDPRNPGTILGVMPAKDMALVSSGDYQRYFEKDGVRYHHIVDPRTGYPSRTSHGTTVFLPSSTDADGLSTTLFILGPDESERVMSRFAGIGAIFVKGDGTVVTKGLVDGFEFK